MADTFHFICLISAGQFDGQLIAQTLKSSSVVLLGQNHFVSKLFFLLTVCAGEEAQYWCVTALLGT